ncbi:TIGR03986 family type III CRISPR-associated RAMP protein [Brevibacillus parabrevis]|uniref:TIGR03986 family type III CRISPR-associated RAMP protein n=1 Tax=Brevibacillus parabrevis TaxID=54914 RepID=UPI0028535C94|nr:TIGR03986 family CRISPR-associated RAMP protein [Brevibacillus parabrevis]MDR5000447.1 TIGR03986 family CRISPR-associated RAMP protein [Brevibacillus parabrevis]
MKGWKETKKRFVNPYNFVPLDGRCERHPAEYYREGERLTGYIECSLTTLTPLIIPNTSNDKALHTPETQIKQSYSFYSYTNLEEVKDEAALKAFHEPVIPGSELRGVIRSVYEAAFKGCLSTADVGRPLYRRAMRPKEPGILRKVEGKWMIELCERYRLSISPAGSEKGKISRKTYDQWEEGKEVSIKLKGSRVLEIRSGHVTNDGFQPGYLHKGEAFPTKKSESVFVPKRDEDHNKTLIPVQDDEITRLNEVLSQYADVKLNRHIGKRHIGKRHTGYAAYRKVFDEFQKTSGQGRLLVYYSTYKLGETEQATYLTPAMISREVYRKTVGDLLKANGEYQPCTDRNHVCPACGLFGMTGKEPKSSLGSRIRFSDAEYVPNDFEGSSRNMYQSILLPELGEPKPGAVEFYTMPPVKMDSGYKIWTYDDVLESSKDIRPLDSHEPRLRGRKFYWHHLPKSGETNSGLSHSDGNAAMQKIVRAIKKNNSFQFRIYFDQVTKKELAQLYWALTMGGGNKYAHKIGHGKPLGYGSARIKPESLRIRRIDPESGERSLSLFDSSELNDHMPKRSEAMKQLQLMADFESPVSGSVSYPKVVVREGTDKINDGASHQWFKANMSSDNKFCKVLPTVEQEIEGKQAVHLFEVCKKNSGSKPK